MRDVIYFKYSKNQETNKWEKVAEGHAKLHQFGVGYEETEHGVGNYSTAIIEKEDGSVENIPVEMIKFI